MKIKKNKSFLLILFTTIVAVIMVALFISYKHGIGDGNNTTKICNHRLHVNHVDTIPSIHITTDGGVGDTLTKDDGYVEAQIVFEDSKSQIISDDSARIKIRGNSTSSGEKKPYNIKFSEKFDLFGSGEKAKKYCLLAECYEPTLMRNYLFFNLAKAMDMEYVSDVEYIDVYIDDKYKGLYLLAEPVEIDKNRVNIDEENGDFLFEIERDRVEEDVTYVYTPSGIRFAMCGPEEPTDNQLEYINLKIEELDKAILSNDDELIKKTIDIDSFAKLYILNEYAKTVDFAVSSVKFYYKDEMFYAGPVWDFDLSSGNASDTFYTTYYSSDGTCYKDIQCDEHIYLYLCKNNLFKNKVKQYFDEYYDLFEDVFLKGGFIDELLKEYNNYYERNYSSASDGAGWIINKQYSDMEVKRKDNYIENVDYLKDWLINRLYYLKENNWWDN